MDLRDNTTFYSVLCICVSLHVYGQPGLRVVTQGCSAGWRCRLGLKTGQARGDGPHCPACGSCRLQHGGELLGTGLASRPSSAGRQKVIEEVWHVEGVRSQKGLFCAGNRILSIQSKETYLKNDFSNDKCPLNKKAVGDYSSPLGYDTVIVLRTLFGVPQLNFFFSF